MRRVTDESLNASGGDEKAPKTSSSVWSRIRFLLSWGVAIGLIAVVLPRVLNISWGEIWDAMAGLGPKALALLFLLWLGGLICHTFVLVAAAPKLSHRRALTLNLTGSAISNVAPMGGAAGMELNRRMMKVWGIDAKGFTGFTFLTNLWDVASKFLLPVLAIAVLASREASVSQTLLLTAVGAAIGFVAVCIFGVIVLRRPSATVRFGHGLERFLNRASRIIRRPHEFHLTEAMLEIRTESLDLVRAGWLQMSTGMAGYVALQGVLLWACLDLTGANAVWVAVLVGYAVERLLTVVPITPGGVGFADIGLVGVLIALGADPAGAAAGAVLYRAFVFAIEIPIGGGALGLWVLNRWHKSRRQPVAAQALATEPRIAHVTDVFLPNLGGIETHVDDLVRHQQAAGQVAHVLTPTGGSGEDPAWVRRVSVREARKAIAGYDVAHIHISMVSPFGLAVALAAISARVPVLVTMHSMWAGRGVPVKLMGRTMLRRWPVAWSAVSGAAARIFTESLPGTEVAVLADAVDVEAWRPDPTLSAAHDAAVAAGGPVTIVSVMRLAPRKRPLALLESFHAARTRVPNRDLRLVLVGEGKLRGRIEKYVAEHDLADVVTITGRLPREQVHAQLSAASVYVAPTAKEAFGIAALEARCAGLPIIAARTSGVADFVEHRVDGLLIDNDEAMTEAITALGHDDVLRQRITDHNRQVPPAFDWSDALVRTQDLYRFAALQMHGTVPENFFDEAGESAAQEPAQAPGPVPSAPAAVTGQAARTAGEEPLELPVAQTA